MKFRTWAKRNGACIGGVKYLTKRDGTAKPATWAVWSGATWGHRLWVFSKLGLNGMPIRFKNPNDMPICPCEECKDARTPAARRRALVQWREVVLPALRQEGVR